MANQFGRYVWLVSILREHGKLTLEEIQRKWENCGLYNGDPLSRRTFYNHRKDIADIFDVDIECDTNDNYRYYIVNQENLEGDSFRSWLIDSYSVLNQVKADRRLEGRIIFEKVPSASNWLTTITNAIRNSHVLYISHQGYGRQQKSEFEIEPYYLKVSQRRWYVIARSPYYSERNKRKNKEDGGSREEDVYRVYGLDRILSCIETDKTFDVKSDFDINEYFKGCYGILPSRDPIKKIIFRSTTRAADFIRSLPLHESQVELVDRNDEDSVYFQLEVRPTFDFYQALLAECDQIEVLEPEEVRDVMRNFTRVLASYYLRDED